LFVDAQMEKIVGIDDDFKDCLNWEFAISSWVSAQFEPSPYLKCFAMPRHS
jgi:hypothetical protein